MLVSAPLSTANTEPAFLEPNDEFSHTDRSCSCGVKFRIAMLRHVVMVTIESARMDAVVLRERV